MRDEENLVGCGDTRLESESGDEEAIEGHVLSQTEEKAHVMLTHVHPGVLELHSN